MELFKNKFSYYSLKGVGILVAISILIGIFNSTAFIGLIFIGFYISPLIILTLLVMKLLDLKKNDIYLYYSLGLNLILLIFALYSVSHIF